MMSIPARYLAGCCVIPDGTEKNLSVVESPCTKHCEIHQSTKVCIGCGRTLLEIEQWPIASIQVKRDIIARLPERLRMISACDLKT
jgi:predicted Fe-S protein YdhL (DUF1289 family)